VDERTERLRRRFDSLLDDARAALGDAAADPWRRSWQAAAMSASAKALNRAGGFLEAVAIAFPELGRELIVRFEEVARNVEQIHNTRAGRWVIRARHERRTLVERRQADPRPRADGEPWQQEKRRAVERRGLVDRRFGARAGR
jgi:hypothetical protein